MSRILVVAYRPYAGQTDAVLTLLREQYVLVSGLGLMSDRQPWVMQSTAGEIIYVAEFKSGSQVEACWEHAEFQDLDARLSSICDMVPMRSIHEASASYIDAQGLHTVGADR